MNILTLSYYYPVLVRKPRKKAGLPIHLAFPNGWVCTIRRLFQE